MGERKLHCDYCRKVHLHSYDVSSESWECNCCGSLRKADGITESLYQMQRETEFCKKCVKEERGVKK